MATTEIGPTVLQAQQLEPGVYSPDLPKNQVLLPQGEEQFQAPLLPTRVLPPNELPNPRPARVLFAGLRDPRLRMVKAVPLDVTVEESNVVVCWPDIDEFGTGDTLSLALDDFANGVRELYHRLIAPEVSLGPDLQRVRGVLEQYIQPRK
jgi:hypothetical protein